MAKIIFYALFLNARKNVQKRMPARVARVSSETMDMRMVRSHGSIRVPDTALRNLRSGNMARRTSRSTKTKPTMPRAAMMPRYWLWQFIR